MKPIKNIWVRSFWKMDKVEIPHQLNLTKTIYYYLKLDYIKSSLNEINVKVRELKYTVYFGYIHLYIETTDFLFYKGLDIRIFGDCPYIKNTYFLYFLK